MRAVIPLRDTLSLNRWGQAVFQAAKWQPWANVTAPQGGEQQEFVFRGNGVLLRPRCVAGHHSGGPAAETAAGSQSPRPGCKVWLICMLQA